MKIIRLAILLILFHVYGCAKSSQTNSFKGRYYELSSLYYQKIPNSSKVLYKFDAWSKLNDSNVNGLIIFDSTEVVKMSKINESLPFKYLVDLPNDRIVKGIAFLQPEEKFDIEEKIINKFSIRREGLEIQVIEREIYTGYSTINCFLHDYEFEEVQESGDSLFFKGISSKRESLPKLDKGIKFRKGNIVVHSDTSGFITQIEVSEIVEEVGDLYKYKYGTKELEQMIEDKFVLCVRNYHFRPTKKIHERELSSFGVFKSKY